MKIENIVRILNDFASKSLASDWDNVGLLIGDMSEDVTGIVLALDVTESVIDQAIECGANMIVSHHPLFFVPSETQCEVSDKREQNDSIGVYQSQRLAIFDTLTDTQKRLIDKIESNNINVFAMHTNLDITTGGIGWTLAKMLGGRNIQNIDYGFLFEIDPKSYFDLAKEVADVLGDNSVKIANVEDRQIEKCYVVSGSGGDGIYVAMQKADVLITGDIKHHIYIESVNNNCPMIEYSHFKSEIICQDILFDKLSSELADTKIVKATVKCPFECLGNSLS